MNNYISSTKMVAKRTGECRKRHRDESMKASARFRIVSEKILIKCQLNLVNLYGCSDVSVRFATNSLLWSKSVYVATGQQRTMAKRGSSLFRIEMPKGKKSIVRDRTIVLQKPIRSYRSIGPCVFVSSLVCSHLVTYRVIEYRINRVSFVSLWCRTLVFAFIKIKRKIYIQSASKPWAKPLRAKH